jgi:hypothetical protein
MAATATILNVWCLRHATGTDFGVNQSLSGLLQETIPEWQLGGASLDGFLKAIPEVVSAMDSARSDPDNMYITTDTSGGAENRIWPLDTETRDMQAGQSSAPGVTLPVDFSQNISLWDQDSGFLSSDDDLLGSITIFEEERGSGVISKLAKSDVESSYYYVTYRVD